MNRIIFTIAAIAIASLAWLAYSADTKSDSSYIDDNGNMSRETFPDRYVCADDIVLDVEFSADKGEVTVQIPEGDVARLRQLEELKGWYADTMGVSLRITADETTLVKDDAVLASECRVVSDEYGLAGDPTTDLEKLDWLQASAWHWEKTKYTSGRIIEPAQEDVFTLRFQTDGQVAVQTDCNSMMGSYTYAGDQELSFSTMASTLLFCEDSQEAVFANMLEQVVSYELLYDGFLVLVFVDEVGSMELRPSSDE